MATEGRSKVTLGVGALALASLLLLASPSDGQVFDDPSTTTTSEPSTTTTDALVPSSTTTAPDGSTTTTRPPDDDPAPAVQLAPDDESTPPPEGSGTGPGGDGDGGDAPPPGSARTVPDEARRIIDSVQRSGPRSSADLLEAVQPLIDLGLSREEAIRIGFGRFPVAGAARYSHDWLYPRWGPGFRFHLGTDVFAAHGTPLRAPVDGTVSAGQGSLGGLYVKIFMDDGTYFYFAHMSGLVDGFTEGMAVKTGDIVGYVGDSGNAKGTSPHLHIGIYPGGGPATDPKPVLDQFLDDAMARLPGIIEQVAASRGVEVPDPADAPAPPVSSPPPAWYRSSPLAARAAGQVPTEILYQTTGNPSAGGVSVARTEAERLAASVDWDAWATRGTARQELIRRAEQALRDAFGPIVGGGDSQVAAR